MDDLHSGLVCSLERVRRCATPLMLSSACLLLAACGHSIELGQLGSPPTSGPRTNKPFAAGGSTNPEYRIWSEDVLVLRVFASGGRADCRAPGDASQTISEADLRTPDDILQLVRRPVKELRIPVDLGGPRRRLQIEASGTSYQVTLPAPEPGQTWASYREQFSGTCMDRHIAISLSPAEPTAAEPGDWIALTRTSLVSDGSMPARLDTKWRDARSVTARPAPSAPTTAVASAVPEPARPAQEEMAVAADPGEAAAAPQTTAPRAGTAPTAELFGLIRNAVRQELESVRRDSPFRGDVVRREAERYELVVDSAGFITLPQVTRVSDFPVAGSGGGAIFADRAWASAGLEAANARLRASGYPLPLLARCLSKAAAFEDDDIAPRCPGVDARFAPALSDGGARSDVTYILEHGPRSWVLIDEDRRATKIPFAWGRTISSAVERAYPARRGRHLIRPGRTEAFLTVLPRGGEPPFTGVLSATDRSLDQLLLMPGDTVHVTYVPARRIRLQGS